MQKSEQPLLIEIQSSQYLLIFIVVIHIVAILASMMVAVMWPITLLFLALVCCSFYFHLRRYRQGYYLGTIKYTKEFAWQQVIQQQFSAMQILNSSVITSFIIILHVTSVNQRRSLLICCDAVPNEVYRQMRVALKINAQNSE